MRKFGFVFIIIAITLLIGCQKNDIDYDALYDEYYSDIEYVESDNLYDICEGVEDGEKISFEIEYAYEYENLSEMIESETAKFMYGEIYKVDYYNCISNNAYLMVYDSEFADESRELIRVSITDDVTLNVNQQYILNLVYNEEYDVYYLSQVNDSIIHVDSAETLSGVFLTEEYPKNLKGFLGEVFDME